MFSQEVESNVISEIEGKISYDYDSALVRINQYLLEFPESDYLNGMKAFLLNSIGRGGEAKKNIQETIKLNAVLKEKTFTNFSLGIISFSENDPEISYNYYLKSLNADTNKINKWVRLYLFYFFLNQDPLLALNYLKESIEIDPYFIIARNELGIIYREEGQPQKALEILEPILKMQRDPATLFNIGLVHIDLGNMKLAKSFFTESVSIKPSVKPLISLAYIEESEGRNVEAEELYRKAILVDPKDDEAYQNLGMLKLRAGLKEESIAFFNTAYTLNPSFENTSKLVFWGINYDMPTAEKYFRELKEKFDNNYEVGFFEILIHCKKGQSKKCQESFNEYCNNHNSQEITWVRNQLKEWGIIIKQY